MSCCSIFKIHWYPLLLFLVVLTSGLGVLINNIRNEIIPYHSIANLEKGNSKFSFRSIQCLDVTHTVSNLGKYYTHHILACCHRLCKPRQQSERGEHMYVASDNHSSNHISCSMWSKRSTGRALLTSMVQTKACFTNINTCTKCVT